MKDCLHRLDVQRLTTEQREELIEDLMALKDTVEEEEVCSALERGFCVAQLAKSAPWSLLVNRFAVLDVEEVNINIHEPIDVPPLSSALDRTAQPQKPKWEKRLPKQLSVNILDAHGTSIILPIEVSTTDTSEVHSVKALLDSGAMGNFIDQDFV